MSFKMKGSPAKMGTIQGTAGHSSALKLHAEASALKALENEKNYSDDEELEGQFEKQEKLEKKEAKRDAKRESGKKVFLGKLKTKVNKKKREKIQKGVDEESFGDAFNAAKDAGRSTFTWRGKSYTTETSSEKEEKEDYMGGKPKGVDLDATKKEQSGVAMKGSPAKHKASIFPRVPPHPHDADGNHLEFPDLPGSEKEEVEKDEPVKETAEDKVEVEKTTTTKKKSKKEIKKEKKLNKLYNKRSDLKSEGGDVKGSDKVDRKYRRTQNKINKALDSKVRHRKNIFTGGKYKKVVKK